MPVLFAVVAIATTPGAPEGQLGIFRDRTRAEQFLDKTSKIDPQVNSPGLPGSYTLHIVEVTTPEDS